jgi:[ribosomal protein S5]-alanine N-acetyltransferase
MSKTLCRNIESERLSIEPLNQAHAYALYDGLMDDRLYQWISTTKPPSASALAERYAAREAVWRGLNSTPEQLQFTSSSKRRLDWAVHCREQERTIGKLDVEFEGSIATNVGYIIFPEFWNQGFATEAVQVLAAALEQAGVVEQRAYVTRGNDASVRVMEKAKFRFTRVIPDNDVIRGEKYDDLEFVRTLAE